MAIINLTPDSFSDGGKFIGQQHLCDHLAYLEKKNHLIFDFGAESTAPFNSALPQADEIARFDHYLLPALNKIDFNNKYISIDTYKMDVFKYVYTAIKSSSPSAQVIWNDVSGILDSAVIEILKIDCPDAHYVYCHTFNESRSNSSDHMDYAQDISPQELLCKIIDSFECARSKLKKEGLLAKVFFDPCFGFGKNFEQNIYLLDNLATLMKCHQQWVIGISRKSFLQRLCLEQDQNDYERLKGDKKALYSATDDLALRYYQKWTQQGFMIGKQVYIRLHQPF